MGIWIGGWCSHSRLARLDILDEQWKTCCHCCLANVPETLSHFLCECTRLGLEKAGFCGSMVKLLSQIPAIIDGNFRNLLGGRLIIGTNSLEENSSTTVEMQEKKASDEAIFIDSGRLLSLLINPVVLICLVAKGFGQWILAVLVLDWVTRFCSGRSVFRGSDGHSYVHH